MQESDLYRASKKSEERSRYLLWIEKLRTDHELLEVTFAGDGEGSRSFRFGMFCGRGDLVQQWAIDILSIRAEALRVELEMMGVEVAEQAEAAAE